jgi:hypothetical protein
MYTTILAEVTDCDTLLFETDGEEVEGGNINFQFLADHATFEHRNAHVGEYILHIGDPEYANYKLTEMEEHGCTPEFIELYKQARDQGACRILFAWAG